MQHRIIPTDGDPIPGHPWTLVATPGEVIVFINWGEVTPGLLEEAWEGYRTYAAARPPRRAEAV